MLSAEPQREALSKGGQILSVPFLASPAVQRELNAIVSKALLNNLDIERKHFHDKASEKGQPKIRSLSRLSRTQDLKFAALLHFANGAYPFHRRSSSTCVCALCNRPHGQRRWQEKVPEAYRKSFQYEGDPEACACMLKSVESN